MLEEAKVVMRNSRRDVLEKFKAFKKDSKITEDEYAGLEQDVQKELDSTIVKAEKAAENKEKEIMEI